MKTRQIKEILIPYLKKHTAIHSDDLLSLLSSQQKGISQTQLRWYIFELKKEGLITDISKGVYAIPQNEFIPPDDSKDLRQISEKIKDNLPYLKFCIWKTAWVHDLMIHQPSSNLMLIEIEGKAEESIYSLLEEEIPPPLLIRPTKKEIERYILGADRFIIRPLIHDAPLKIDLSSNPRIEKILVDLWSDEDLFQAYQGKELENIFVNAMNSFNVNLTTLLAYAERRRKRKKLIEFLNAKIKERLNDTYRIAFKRMA